MKKRILSVVLAIMMIATIVPASIFSAFAAESAYELIIEDRADIDFFGDIQEDQVVVGYTGTLPDNLVIPEGVKGIKHSVFQNCTNLESVTIPESVTSIGENAFYGCTSLATISVGSNITYLGYMLSDSAFYNNSSNWENDALYLTARDGITKYLLAVKPEFSGVFTIKEGTKILADATFLECENLEGVTIPDSVITIGNGAFMGCTNLANVSIGNGVTSIIGGYVFSLCESLTSITADSNNEVYSSDEHGVLFDKNKTTLIQYPTGNERTSYEIPSSVTTIKNGAFLDCKNLESITIPDSVTTIGEGAFMGCTSLANVLFLEGEINLDSAVGIWDRAFADCTALESVKFGNKATIIGDSTFEGCKSLKSVTFGNCVSIGTGAFEGCTNLENVTISMLDCVEYTVEGFGTFKCDPIRVIGISAFKGCTNLKSVTILNRATTLDSLDLFILDGAFYGCTSLVKVEMILRYQDDISLEKLEYNIFGNCNENLTIYSNTDFVLKKYADDNGINFENIVMFTVIFVDGEEILSKQEVRHGETVTAPTAPQKEGYTFVGWFDKDDNFVDVETLAVTSDMKLTAKYEINSYYVTLVMFDGEEEQTLGSLPIKHGEGLGEFAAQFEEIVAEEAGEAFYLAYFIEDEQVEFKEIDIYDFVVEDDITIYMAVLPRIYYVKFVDEDGTAIGNEEGEIVLHGEKVTAPTAPEKENYVFVGWVDEDGNLVDLAEKEITEDITLTAKYEINSFTVTFFAGARKPGKTEEIAKKVEVAYGSDPSKIVTKDFVNNFDFNTKKFLRFFFCLFWKPTGRWTDSNGNVVTTITSDITLYAEYDWFWNV